MGQKKNGEIYPLSSLNLQAQVGYQWIQMCFLLGLLIYIPQMVNTFKTYPLIQHLGSCFISRPLTRVHGHCRHIYTVTTFKYVEGGPDREALEVV